MTREQEIEARLQELRQEILTLSQELLDLSYGKILQQMRDDPELAERARAE